MKFCRFLNEVARGVSGDLDFSNLVSSQQCIYPLCLTLASARATVVTACTPHAVLALPVGDRARMQAASLCSTLPTHLSPKQPHSPMETARLTMPGRAAGRQEATSRGAGSPAV
eukprot:scaffold127774_cov17-Tisochrysis_lutea.AAC.1